MKLIIPRVRQTSEKTQDDRFRLLFSDDRIAAMVNDIDDEILSRGWKREKIGKGFMFVRDGVWLQSEKAFEIDRLSASAFHSCVMMLELQEHVLKANPEGLRALRMAYSTGMNVAEAWAFRKKALGRGRKPAADLILRGIDAAYEKWLKTPIGQGGAPKAADLRKLYVSLGPDFGSERNFANWVSKWRKLQRNKKSE